MHFEIFSPAFSPGAMIPVRHTCNGEDVSPPLAWSNVPAPAKSLALVCEDPDAPGGTFYHWGIHDLPTTVTSLAEGVDTKSIPEGVKIGRASCRERV